jgi:hypothetical protein
MALTTRGEGMGRFRRLLAVAGCIAAVAALGAGPAFAGEITGNGKWIAGSADAPLNGRSECAYSGQNDTYTGDPAVPDADGFTRTQSWGQVARHLQGAAGGVPGTACNPEKSEG